MKLNLNELKNTQCWEKANIILPKFDYDKIKASTKENPTWVHFGAGNIFRGFVAKAHQNLLDKKLADTGIIAVETFDYEVIEKVYEPCDNLALVVLMNSDGSFDKTVVASIVEGITTKMDNGDYDRLVKAFENPSLQMASFTITEKGYALKDFSGQFFSFVKSDLEKGPASPTHAMSVVTALVYKRYLKGKYPMALVSMDNCSHNGDKVKEAVITIAKEWQNRGFVEKGFVDYITDEKKITFPLSMIDKITPRPAEVVKEALEKDGVEDIEVVITSKNTYMAPFVNAEVCEYLVIEDKFPNGRPALEESGILFTDRETVNNVETMKVTTCLNPLHTALAVTGCLLGHTLIADEMKDDTLKKLVEKIGYDEGLPVVLDPKILSPKKFIDEVVNERFANPYIPDTPQRIATDTSQKVGIRFGETIKSYVKDESLDAKNLVGIPLAIASWCRYLMGVDDKGNEMILSSDPMIDTLKNTMDKIKMRDTSADLSEILSNKDIFGVNLYEIGLGNKIENMFLKMIKEPGAVRTTINMYL
ncbi:mannitol dehydrogenase family protein [Clostridium grantii]|uniref:Fructuronate reductase n=1 Tax=Clostridium grantii DSM 8605 TaxID=1121316 RepID=A0A1M5X484_9CLOT|nr:mannitol dehydrogenase family protein [Clostridium grantii]SHH94660.1 fructuronate reductase [Clostridium grantii DSM 8605]